MNSKKSWRALVANLLVVLLVTTCHGGSFITKRSIPAAQDVSDGKEITAGEEREASQVAEHFLRRMQETNDFAPLVREMFVPDYETRLRQEALNKPLALLSKSAVEQASREELLRYDLALNNSLYLASLIVLDYKTSHAEEDDSDVDDGLPYYRQVLPPDIFELCLNDPVLKALFAEETNEGAEAGQAAAPLDNSDAGDKDEEADAEPIRSVRQLRSFTSTLEQAIVLARRHLDALPRAPAFVERHRGASEEENWKAEREAFKPRAWVLNREFYGYPEGTRIFCVTVNIYHMDLVRVDGKLKALALHLDMD